MHGHTFPWNYIYILQHFDCPNLSRPADIMFRYPVGINRCLAYPTFYLNAKVYTTQASTQAVRTKCVVFGFALLSVPRLSSRRLAYRIRVGGTGTRLTPELSLASTSTVPISENDKIEWIKRELSILINS